MLEKSVRDPKVRPQARLLSAARQKILSAGKLTQMEVLAVRLRWMAMRKDRAAAGQAFAKMQARVSGNPLSRSILSGAALRAAREAALSREWLPACRLWVWFANVSGEKEKAIHNIVHCARSPTRQQSGEEGIATALDAWSLLALLEPQSKEARQGMAWCHTRLAQEAEQQAELGVARAHWSEVLAQFPSDKAALDALRRTQSASAVESQAHSEARRDQSLALYERLKRRVRSEHNAQCAAGKRLLDAGAPELALRFLEPAFRRRKSAQAAELVFRCCVRLARFSEAASMLPILAREGMLGRLHIGELHAALSQISHEALDPEVLAAITKTSGGNPEIAGALLPHLLAHDLVDFVVATVKAPSAASENWPAPLILKTANYLNRIGERALALRVLAVSSGDAEVAAAFSRAAEALSPDELEALRQHHVTERGVFSAICLAMAEHDLRKREWEGAAGWLSRIENLDFVGLHAGLKGRLGAAVTRLLSNSGADSPIPGQMARLLMTLASGAAKQFFAGPDFPQLCSALMAESRFANAPLESRRGLLREHYFEHHLERRENQPVATWESDFAFSEAALRYFAALAAIRPVEQIPISSELRIRLTRPRFAFGGSSADLLMSYAILRNRPETDLVSSTLFDRLARWYIERFMPENKVPSVCTAPDALARMNIVLQAHPQLGVSITQFADDLHSAGTGPESYIAENAIDAVLFALDAIARFLPGNAQNRPLFSAMLPPENSGGPSFIDLCIAALAAQPMELPFSSLLSRQVGETPRRTEKLGADVLLIGHGGQGTGLSRNFRMLKEALEEAGQSVTAISYELTAHHFAEELQNWRMRCEGQGIVAAAVNAQDIPSLFIRDRHDVLTDCHVVGFFLWETSAAPSVQHLGIGLVDEIWTPTHYVAEVYAPFGKPVHVVGKGLFSRDRWPRRPFIAEQSPIRFLTIFDFHSSPERKNPLASVLAFQKAFRGGENVELIIKASNVDPQHPGNASGQWEQLCAASAGDRRIRVITERYSEEQMRELMRRVSCVVSLHRSEGFGYVLSDAMALGIPVIGTDYSGNTDFCDAETSFPVAYRLIPVQARGTHWESEGTVWADADIESAAAQMLRVYRGFPEALRKAAVGQQRLLGAYSKEAFAARLRERLASIRGGHRVDPALAATQQKKQPQRPSLHTA